MLLLLHHPRRSCSCLHLRCTRSLLQCYTGFAARRHSQRRHAIFLLDHFTRASTCHPSSVAASDGFHFSYFYSRGPPVRLSVQILASYRHSRPTDREPPRVQISRPEKNIAAHRHHGCPGPYSYTLPPLLAARSSFQPTTLHILHPTPLVFRRWRPAACQLPEVFLRLPSIQEPGTRLQAPGPRSCRQSPPVLSFLRRQVLFTTWRQYACSHSAPQGLVRHHLLLDLGLELRQIRWSQEMGWQWQAF